MRREHRVAAAFVKTFDGPVNDNIAPIGHSLADTQIGAQSGITVGAHLSDLIIRGRLILLRGKERHMEGRDYSHHMSLVCCTSGSNLGLALELLMRNNPLA